jgi:transporter family protein
VTARWLVPTLLYLVALGALGVTGKLALRTLVWQELVLWTGAGYVLVSIVLLSMGDAEIRFVEGTSWAILSGALAIGALITLYLALGTGEASTVIPISAAYPAITLLLSAAFLSEGISMAKLGGMCLVVGGVVVLTVTG